MEKRKSSAGVPVKLGVDAEWLVSEARWINPEGFQCLLERSIPLHSKVHVVLMLPSKPKGMKVSQKIDCEGLVKSIQCVPDEKKELKYQTEISFTGLTPSQEQMIAEFSRSLESDRRES